MVPRAFTAISKLSPPVLLNATPITEINKSNTSQSRYLRFPKRFRLSGILFTIYLQSLHAYLQSGFLRLNTIKLFLLHPLYKDKKNMRNALNGSYLPGDRAMLLKITKI